MKIFDHVNARKSASLACLCFFWLALLFAGCDQPRIFSPAGEDTGEAPLAANAADVAIYTHLTGGFAGIDQELFVYEDGLAEFRKNYPQGGSVHTPLSADEFTRLKTLFFANNFLRLQSRYITPNAADMIYFDIIFVLDGEQYRVQADYEAAPPALREIIDALNALVLRLSQKTLRLDLFLSADTLQHGETITLKLTVTNLAQEDLLLRFNDTQFFDFFALPAAPPEVDRNEARGQAQVWNYARDKGFAQVIQNVTLTPNEKMDYEIAWDGRDNQGRLLAGDYYIGGTLTARTGGTTPLKRLTILKGDQAGGE